MKELHNDTKVGRSVGAQSGEDLADKSIDIRSIGAKKNQEISQELNKIGQFLSDAKEAIQDRLNAVVGFATVHLDRTNFSNDQREAVRENAINGFKQNIKDASEFLGQGLEDKLTSPIQGIIQAKIVEPSQALIDKAGAAVDINITKPLQETVKQVSESLDKIRMSMQAHKSAERREMIDKFTDKLLKRSDALVSRFEADDHKEDGQKAIEATRELIKEKVADSLGEGVVSRKDRLDTEKYIKTELAKLNSQLRGIQSHDVFDRRANELDKKLNDRDDLSANTKEKVQIVRDIYLTKLEDRLGQKEQAGKYLGIADIREAKKIASEMSKDVSRRVAVLNRMEKLEKAATNIGDEKVKVALQVARTEFANRTADGEFSKEEAVAMSKLLDGVRDGLLKQQAARGVLDLVGGAVSKLENISEGAGVVTDREIDKLARSLGVSASEDPSMKKTEEEDPWLD